MIPDFKHHENKRHAEHLRRNGFAINYSSTGFTVLHGVNVIGFGKGSDIRANLAAALRCATQHRHPAERV